MLPVLLTVMNIKIITEKKDKFTSTFIHSYYHSDLLLRLKIVKMINTAIKKGRTLKPGVNVGIGSLLEVVGVMVVFDSTEEVVESSGESNSVKLYTRVVKGEPYI